MNGGGNLYSVTSIAGYPSSDRDHGNHEAAPGVSFNVVFRSTGQVAAVRRSEDTPVGLPHSARVRMAEYRALDVAARLTRRAEQTPAA